jgi:hypothetical protein
VGIKNWVGILPGMVYGWSKDNGYDNNGRGFDHTPGRLQKNMVDLFRAQGCDLVIVDATMCRERAKNYWSGIARRRNLIVAGSDVVSVDAVCALLMDINPADVEHISLAAMAGLGQNDPARIEVVGGTVEQCRARFIKDDKIMPSGLRNPDYRYYGQSNRTWLLRGGFEGGEMETDYLNGETDVAPRAGEGGWSEPVYFYDDLIDPAGFFGDSTDAIHYAFSYFDAPANRQAHLWVGSDGPMQVWVNERLVYDYNGAFRVHKLPNDVAEIEVAEGLNRLLVKVQQTAGSCRFSLNICEPESDPDFAGNRLAGLDFNTDGGGIRGDYDGSGKLDIFDLLGLLGELKAPSPDPDFDFNADGRVDIFDLLGLLQALRGDS